MAYISSNANRWYCARESSYGQVPTIAAENRIPAVKLTAKQDREKSTRRDKTGSRTWQGHSAGSRKQTTFELTSYLRDWPDVSKLPPHAALVESAMGSDGVLNAGATADIGCTTTTLKFTAAHHLIPGQAVAFGSELRFVAAVGDSKTVVLNCPLVNAPVAGDMFGSTASFSLSSELPSLSLFDYWAPSTAAQRLLVGAGVDQFKIRLNGDYHQFEVKGMAKDLIDSTSFQSGEGGLPAFPSEPAGALEFSYSVVPGNMGQVWLGATPNQFLTVSDATIDLRNHLDVRAREYGSFLPQSIVPGDRELLINLELFSQDDATCNSLYQAARQDLPISMMFQLGQVPGQLVGIYIKSVIPEVPEFDDSERRLRWKFRDNKAQGTADDELYVAFA